MNGRAYYNEHDSFAAAWLRELIADGLICDGDVDERSIEDVRPSDLAGYTQCHFFAGIGVWSLALRQAGWRDDRPIWTGSCPCQPFSAAGKAGGFADERHLWPALFHLIGECRPSIVVGEQVASKDGLAWLDLVSADLEGARYAFGAVDTCAAGFGAPHIRQRLYFGAKRLDDTAGARHVAARIGAEGEARDEARLRGLERGRGAMRLADALRSGTGNDAGEGLGAEATPDEKDGDLSRERLRPWVEGSSGWMADASRSGLPQQLGVGGTSRSASGASQGQAAERVRASDGGLADADEGQRRRLANGEGCERDREAPGRIESDGIAQSSSDVRGLADSELERPGPTNGLWRDVDWLFCRDGKWRPVESSPLTLADDGSVCDLLAGGGRASDALTFPLAEAGTFKNRVAELRGAGNAVNLAQASGFISSFMEAVDAA